MHLTNYAINKNADNYEDCADDEGEEGMKRSLGAILKILKKEGCDVDKLMEELKEIFVSSSKLRRCLFVTKLK